MKKDLGMVGSGGGSPLVPSPSEPLRVAQGPVPRPPDSLTGYGDSFARPDLQSQVRCADEAVARIGRLRMAAGATDAENLLPEAEAHARGEQRAIHAARAQQQDRLLEGHAAAFECATRKTERDMTDELAWAQRRLQRLSVEEGEDHAMQEVAAEGHAMVESNANVHWLLQLSENLEAREATLRADTLKAEAARAQQGQTPKAPTEARATMDEAAAGGRAMDESEANARRLLQQRENVHAQKTALRADALKAEAARAQQEQTLAAPVGASATMEEAAAEQRAMDGSKANARRLVQLAEHLEGRVQLAEHLEARETALRAESFESEIQAQKGQAVDARARMEAGAEERAMGEVEARERSLEARATTLKAQEAALRAETLKSEAARSQQEQAVERLAQMEARAEERAMVEVKARERKVQELTASLEAREAAFHAETLKSEAIRAQNDHENRVKDEAKAREHSLEELAESLQARDAALQAEILTSEATQLQKEEALQMEAAAGELVMEEAMARERNPLEEEVMQTDSEAQEAAASPGTQEMADKDLDDRSEAAESSTGPPSKRQRIAEGDEGDE